MSAVNVALFATVIGSIVLFGGAAASRWAGRFGPVSSITSSKARAPSSARTNPLAKRRMLFQMRTRQAVG